MLNNSNMWILSFLPNLIVHLVLTAGILLILASVFLGMVPLINRYQIPARIVGIILLGFGLYMEGGISYKEKLELDVAKLEVKLAEAEAKSEKTNVQIVTKVLKDTKIIRERGDDVIKYIETEVVKYDTQCIIPPDVIEAFNRAATLSLPSVTDLPKKENKMSLPARTNP